jgi:hypothetical protein
MARMLRNISFVVLVAAAVSAPEAIDAGNACYIFIGSCSDIDWDAGVIRTSGCQESCETWENWCCASLCGGAPDDDFCYDDDFCDIAPDGPSCMLCTC